VFGAGASAAGIEVRVGSLTSQQLIASLFDNHVAIVLTDRRLLRPKSLDIDAVTGQVHLVEPSDGSTFTGHYVVVCGYDIGTAHFDVRDPASSVPHYCVSAEQLDCARRAFGTDEDILLINLCGD
jgi:hypothetical protein